MFTETHAPASLNLNLFNPEGQPTEFLIQRIDPVIAKSQELFGNQVQGIYLVGSQAYGPKPSSDIDILIKTETLNLDDKTDPRSLALMAVANPTIDPQVLIGVDQKFHIPPSIKPGFFDIMVRSYGPEATLLDEQGGTSYYDFLNHKWIWVTDEIK